MTTLGEEESIEDILAYFKRHNADFHEAFDSATKDFGTHDEVYEATRRRMNIIKQLDDTSDTESRQ